MHRCWHSNLQPGQWLPSTGYAATAKGRRTGGSLIWNVALAGCETYRKSKRTTRQVVARGEYVGRGIEQRRANVERDADR
jgi:hypothetical protein